MSEAAQFEDPMEEEEVLGAKPTGMKLPRWEDVQNNYYTPKEKNKKKKKKKKGKSVVNLEEDAREVINRCKASSEEDEEKLKWHRELLPDGRIVFHL